MSDKEIKDKRIMSDFADKLKEQAEKARDKVFGAGEDAVTGHDRDDDDSYGSSTSGGTGAYKEDAPGTETVRKDDPLTSYREKEPMTPAK